MCLIFQKYGFDINYLPIRKYVNVTSGVSVTFESMDQKITNDLKKIIQDQNGLKTGICKLRLEYKKLRGKTSESTSS